MKRERKYFVARHDLASFQMWPGVVWRTGETDFPRGFRQMQVGDRWIAFAYIDDEYKRDKTQQVVGFYECVSIPTKRIQIPRKPQSLVGNNKLAWAIHGKEFRWQPSFPITVRSIQKLLKRPVYSQQTLTPISRLEFEKIRQEVKRLKLDQGRIPLLNRDPRCEQEVIGILIAAHERLGIEKIDRIRTRFPDLRVKIAGKRGLVHLEVETYSSSFLLHGHQHQVWGRMFKTADKSEKLPIAVVCWDDDDQSGQVAQRVHKIYELRGLLRRKERIKWGR